MSCFSASAIRIGLCGKKTKKTKFVVNTTTTVASYTATLTAGKQYRWNVAAGNTAGLSSYTTVRYFQTPTVVVPPGTPTKLPSPGLTSSPGTLLTSSTVTLSWGAVSGATYYDLGVIDVATGAFVVNTTTTVASYTATLTAGKQYRWNVAAGNTAGLSSYTTVRYFQTPTVVVPPGTPTAPSPGLTSSPGTLLTSSTVTLSWGAVSGATYYDLGVIDVATGAFVVNTTTTVASYTATLTANKQYRWNVAAGNTAGLRLTPRCGISRRPNRAEPKASRQVWACSGIQLTVAIMDRDWPEKSLIPS